MRFGSVCSGIEAASVAWKPLGWEAAWFSEIEPFPSAVLAHHYPTVPNHGDMMTLPERILAGEVEAPDLLCGGTPCQAFSVAGLRRSLDDARGNLTLTFCEVADAIDDVRRGRGEQPAIIVWENVPGVLNTPDNAFGCFLGQLAGSGCALEPAGKRWTDAGCVLGPKRTIAWRVLNAEYFGVPQRRRRVFVITSGRDDFSPLAALFERKGVPGDRASTASQGTASVLGELDYRHGSYPAIWWNGRRVSQTLDAVLYKKQAMPEKNRFPAVLVPAWQPSECCDDYVCNVHGEHVSDCPCPGIDTWAEYDIPPYEPCVLRFITPRECERLQGFPDDYTAIPWRGRPAEDCPDGPRYKALGNSWAVPVVRWIGQRIAEAL